ncbi:uncharacterized protein [Nicotiana sylvestris]|uniref:uncharacterized protein n=1 Tax=Nicotiana sylvestris TaxID=4096 RepID=UPI00388CC97E
MKQKQLGVRLVCLKLKAEEAATEQLGHGELKLEEDEVKQQQLVDAEQQQLDEAEAGAAGTAATAVARAGLVAAGSGSTTTKMEARSCWLKAEEAATEQLGHGELKLEEDEVKQQQLVDAEQQQLDEAEAGAAGTSATAVARAGLVAAGSGSTTTKMEARSCWVRCEEHEAGGGRSWWYWWCSM